MSFFRIKSSKKGIVPSAIEILNSESPWTMGDRQRFEMTVSCRDTDYIPKVKNAGKISKIGNYEIQYMHNGIKVVNGGYFGDWMSDIISDLKGHHEPQEEKVFYEVLNRIDNPGAMIELGSFWAYYSLWYKKKFPEAKVIACEPDPINIKVGINNARLNNLAIDFIQSAAGYEDNKKIEFSPDSSSYQGKVKTRVRTVDSLVKEYKIKELSMLHLDVQGAELDALNGLTATIANNQLRFLFVSTHHYSISGEPSTHLRCLDWIAEMGGHVITEHNVIESFSGDGLIVASFSKRDNNFKVSTSVNTSNNSLFRSYERDLVMIIDAYEQMRARIAK